MEEIVNQIVIHSYVHVRKYDQHALHTRTDLSCLMLGVVMMDFTLFLKCVEDFSSSLVCFEVENDAYTLFFSLPFSEGTEIAEGRTHKYTSQGLTS